MPNFNSFIISLFIGFNLTLVKISFACSSFYCINSCGTAKSVQKAGFKLILANNRWALKTFLKIDINWFNYYDFRDEDIYRLTLPANVWPSINSQVYNSKKTITNTLDCDQSQQEPPFNLCVYGALDIKNDKPPNYYSTWLGINERGSIGNLLFFMNNLNKKQAKPRGAIVSSYLQNSSWLSIESFLHELSGKKMLYNPFNYVALEMDRETGDYSLFYLNNNNSKSFQKMNRNSERFIFGLSNSDPKRPFKKIVYGKQNFKQIIDVYGENEDKEQLLNSLLKLLQNTSSNMPDYNLASFMGFKDDSIIEGVSRLKANYSQYWKNAHTRTSTIILIDYENNVEYYEYNLTLNSSNNWEMNSFKFKLKPLINSAQKNLYSANLIFGGIYIFNFIFKFLINIVWDILNISE